ncbi:MAG: hypothetical protein NT169_05740 [Chloroflexi bacterium]|nr:hypothetical protein [Chloroflexota bacterium]
MSVEMRVVVGLLFLLVTFISGIWLRRSGRPRPVALLTLHKLIPLAAIVLIGLTVRRLGNVAGMSAGAIGAVAVTGGLYLCAIASGGWLSTKQPAPAAISAIHVVAPPLTVLSTGVTLYLLTAGCVHCGSF